MVSLRVENLTLVYPLRARHSLSAAHSRLRGLQSKNRSAAKSLLALDGVTFSLDAGDRLALVGNNGAGKSTLLKVLYGIYTPTSGKSEVEGRVDALFNISLGFRREASGRRNIFIRGLINGWSLEEIDARMDRIIEFSELGNHIDLPFKTYSQGMAARLAFSIATALEPEILLMDEWLGAGDPRFQEKARRRMNELAAHAGIVVLATHNHALLRTTCNKVLELEAARVKYFGDAQTYFDTAAR